MGMNVIGLASSSFSSTRIFKPIGSSPELYPLSPPEGVREAVGETKTVLRVEARSGYDKVAAKADSERRRIRDERTAIRKFISGIMVC